MGSGWIGVDLDGTLAEHTYGAGEIGEPIPEMVARVLKWLQLGYQVRIVTARVGPTLSFDGQMIAMAKIYGWCEKHLGRTIPVIAHKDYDMIELWDDRAVRVERNTGKMLSPSFTWPIPPDRP